MNILYPEFLYALGFLIVPILIHLFNFRKYKTILFSQVRFLKSVRKQTQSTSKIKHWLVLISRCLAIIALVLAFSQPYISQEGDQVKQGKKGINIYLDNSFSMQINGAQGENLEIAKAKALSIANAYSETDQFRILTNDFFAKHSRWYNRKDFIAELQKIEYSPHHKSISEVVSRLKENQSDEKLIIENYLISDLQKNQFDLDKIQDSSAYTIIPVHGNTEDNINLKSLQLLTPYHLLGQEEKLSYRLINHSSEKRENLSVKLYLNEELKSPQTININQEDSTSGEILFRSNESEEVYGKLAIKDYPLTFDDTLYFNFPIQKSIKVVHIFEDQANQNLQVLLATDSLIQYHQQNINELDYSLIEDPALVIIENITKFSSGFRSTISNFVRNGGSVALFPNSKLSNKAFNEFLMELEIGRALTYEDKESPLGSLNSDAQLFESVFEEFEENINLPKVFGRWKFQFNSTSIFETIVSYRDNSSFLSRTEIGKGQFYLSSVGLSEKESGLVNHAIFVPIIFNMALHSANNSPLYYDLNTSTISLSSFSELKDSESPIHIRGNNINFIPPQRFVNSELQISLDNQIKKAGHYHLFKADEKVGSISFNYNRNESEMDFYDVSELIEEAKIYTLNFNYIEGESEVLSSKIAKLDHGIPLWKYFIILALLFLGIEILLIRLI